MHITLRPNEKIYINGAVLRTDRKVSLELMNDAVFLLEAHVMTERAATTPLRRLYFVVQLMLIEPQDLEPKRLAFNLHGLAAARAYSDGEIQAGLANIHQLVGRGRAFEALKVLRGLFPREDALLAGRTAETAGAAASLSAAPAPNGRRLAPRASLRPQLATAG